MSNRIKIFVDVGGHRGETLEVVLSPQYHFDYVHCCEPIPELAEHIRTKFAGEIKRGKLFVHNLGLADFTGSCKLYGTGAKSKFSDGLGASLYPDKKDIDNSEFIECKFKSASEFVTEKLNAEQFVVMKLNCEGGEVNILHDLMESDKIHQIDFMMIDFDAIKVPSMRGKKQEILERLAAIGYSDYIVYGELGRMLNQADGTQMWLSCMPHATQIMDLTQWEKLRTKLLFKMPPKLRYWVMRRRKKIYRLLGLIPRHDQQK